MQRVVIYLQLLCIFNILEAKDKILKNVIIDSAKKIIKKYPQVRYQKVYDPVLFEYPKFQLSKDSSKQFNKGLFDETFILFIPEGKVCSRLGLAQVENHVFDDLYIKYPGIKDDKKYIEHIFSSAKKLKKIKGRVAVITRASTDTYGHWLVHVLGRLALLEMNHVEYDWLYVPYDVSFIKDTLKLLGINPKKIIEPQGDNYYVQADELIVPSIIDRKIPYEGQKDFSNCTSLAAYCPQWTVDYLREKFIPMADQVVGNPFNSKIFISRKNARRRKVLNEDELFVPFDKKGFKRYELEKMSFLQQVSLFKNADYIVGFNGSGLMNLIFGNSDAKVLEIFQQRLDATFFYIAMIMHMHHTSLVSSEKVNDSVVLDTIIDVKKINNDIQQFLLKVT